VTAPEPVLARDPEWSNLKTAATIATIAAGLVVLISSFFPWYGVSFHSLGTKESVSIDAWHGASILALMVALVAPVVSVIGRCLRR
jgi:hypothetical protein